MRKKIATLLCALLPVVLSAQNENEMDWRYGKYGVRVVTNAPSRQEMIAATNALEHSIVEFVYSPSNPPPAQPAPSRDALRLVSADSNWWVSVVAGTATLWHVVSGTGAWRCAIPALGADFEVAGLSFPLSDVFDYTTPDYLYRVHVEGSTGALYDFTVGSGFGQWDAADAAGVSPVELAITSNGGTGSAWLTLDTTVATNAVGTYVTAADLAAAISNALAQAGDSAAALVSAEASARSSGDVMLSNRIDTATAYAYSPTNLPPALTNILVGVVWTNSAYFFQLINP